MPSLSKIRSDFAFYPVGKWIEFFILLSIAVFIAVAVLKIDYKVGVLMAAGSIALMVLILCFYYLEVGVYCMLIFGFLLAFIDRMNLVPFSLVTILMALPFVLFMILMALQLTKRRQPWMIWHPILFVYLTTVGYTIIQAFNPGMDSLAGWLSYLRGILIFFITLMVFLYIFKDKRSIRFFFKFIFVAFFVSAFYAYVQQKFGFTSFERRWLYTTPGVNYLYALPGGGMRKFSFFSDPANFGTLMSTGALGVIIIAMETIRRRRKIVLGFFAVIILLGVSYSGTRTAYLTVTAGIAFYIIMTFYQKRSRIMAAFAAVVLLFILYVPIYGNATINRVRSAFQPPSEDASYNLRNIHRHSMQPFMQKHPFGNGINTTMGAGKTYNPNNFLAGFPPDSEYFKMALEQGWIGMVLNCIFFFTILFYAIHYFYRSKDREIKAYYGALAAMLFSMILGAYTQFTITAIPQNFVFISLIACIIKLHTFDTCELSGPKS